jgi:hypothetical protein
MIENIVPIYRLEYSETPFGSPGKNLAHISPKIVQGLCSSKFAVFLSPQRPCEKAHNPQKNLPVFSVLTISQ